MANPDLARSPDAYVKRSLSMSPAVRGRGAAQPSRDIWLTDKGVRL